MNKTGYVIAKNKGLNEFFTSSSAYDRPRWVSLEEATAYPTADLAQAASTKLYKSSGSYEARLVSVQELTEARGRSMAYSEPSFPDDDGSGDMEAPESDMVAAKQGMDPSIDPEADDQMGLADTEHPDDEEDQADIEGMVDTELGDDDMDDGTVGMPGEDDEIENLPDVGFDEDETDINFGPDENEENAQLRPEEVRMMKPRGRMSESATNGTTANKLKATPEIKYKDAANVSDKPDTDLTTTGAQPNEDKIKVPAGVAKDLKAVIAEFEKTAKFANTRDDAKASFCMTVVEALKELMDYLDMGTVESLKLAQIHMAGLMSPITQHIPDSVKKFVLMGGRKPTLKDLFDSKRETKKGL